MWIKKILKFFETKYEVRNEKNLHESWCDKAFNWVVYYKPFWSPLWICTYYWFSSMKAAKFWIRLKRRGMK